MRTLGNIKSDFQEQLNNLYDSQEINALFQIIIEDVLNIPRTQIGFSLNSSVESEKAQKIDKLLFQLSSGKPIQHILGKAPFYGMEFKVNEHTLIPRPETEELVDLIVKQHKNNQNISIIDIGTGSGCIAICLKKHLPAARVVAIDISKEALSVAKENATLNNVDVGFRCLDILEWEYTFGEDKFDVVVSNPPYITNEERKDMHQNVLSFEPESALFVPDEAPLLFYDYIADFSKSHLHNLGHLYFEINQYLSEETKDLLVKKGFDQVQILHDLNNSPRMISSILKKR